MHHKETGIILRQFSPTTHKFCVLSAIRGKIVLVVLNVNHARTIRSGALIEYVVLEQNHTTHTTNQVEILLTPLTQQVPDFYWLHHLLEISYFFLPLHQPAEESYQFLLTCIAMPQPMDTGLWNTIKKCCVGLLLIQMGFYPPEILQPPLLELKDGIERFIDISDEQKVEFFRIQAPSLEKLPNAKLEQWLWQCIQSHPRMNAFKTVAFMYNNY